MLQIPPSAKGTAFAPEHGNAGGIVRVKQLERLKERFGAFGVHGIARLRAGMYYSPDRTVPFNAYAH